jgi:hypothetical protein
MGGFCVNSYQAVACQGAFDSAHTKDELNKNIGHALDMIQWGAYTFCFNDPARLFAFGELNITGIPGITRADWEKMADLLSISEAEDIAWIEEASKALEQEPIRLEFLEEALVA